MPTRVMRISEESYDALEQMAEQEQMPASTLLDEAVRRLRQELYARRFNDAYAKLREDPVAWAEEEAERRAWDGVIADGLDDGY